MGKLIDLTGPVRSGGFVIMPIDVVLTVVLLSCVVGYLLDKNQRLGP